MSAPMTSSSHQEARLCPSANRQHADPQVVSTVAAMMAISQQPAPNFAMHHRQQQQQHAPPANQNQHHHHHHHHRKHWFNHNLHANKRPLPAPACNNKAQAFLSRDAQAIVRMRGLPFTCSAQQVVDFFNQTVLGADEGVLFVRNQDDKPTGDAFVLFATEETAHAALAKHRQNIGSRYVELFRSSISEVQQVLSMSAAQTSLAAAPVAQPNEPHTQRRRPSPNGSQSGAKHRTTSNTGLANHSKSSPVTYAQVATSAYLQPATSTETGSAQLSAGSGLSSASSSTSSASGAYDSNSLNSTSSSLANCSALNESTTESATLVGSVDDAPVLEQVAGSSSPASQKSTSSGTGSAIGPHQAEPTPPMHQHQQFQYQPATDQYQSTGVHYFNGPPNAFSSPAYLANQARPYQQHAHHQHHQMAAYAAQLAAYSYPFYQPAPPPPPIPGPYLGAGRLPSNQQHQDQPLARRDCIRLRGLPFEAQIEHVLYFLADHSKNIVYQGVHMVYTAQGQPTGEAIIQMNSCAAAQQAALEFHRKVMSVGKKQRYIEVIPSSIDDLNLMLGGHLRPLPAGPLLNGVTNPHQPATYYSATSQEPTGDFAAGQSQPTEPKALGGTATPKPGPSAQATGSQHDQLVPAAYYPVLYYYPQQMLAAPAYH